MAIADGNRFGNVRSSPASAALAAAGRGAGDTRHPLQLPLQRARARRPAGAVTPEDGHSRQVLPGSSIVGVANGLPKSLSAPRPAPMQEVG